MADPTQAALRAAFDYDQSSGRLTDIATGLEVGWSNGVGGHRRMTFQKRKYYVHRIIFRWMTGEWPSLGEHENLDASDNRWDNLRPANKSLNGANIRVTARNKVGLKGVSKCAATGMFRADITIESKKINLGRVDCPAAASFRYQIAAHKAFGKYSRAF
jgi:hypothetical protein